MELDIKNLGDQDMRQLVKSLELVSARVLDSVVRAGQLAGSATPEMQALFAEWVGCLGGELTRAVEEKGAIDPEALAKTIGVTPATIISLALALHRHGAIKITEIKAEPSDGRNTEICGCLQNN
ncbi:hypothetical protein [Cloacibacillus sp. An23]|uniref:hypothetical protein n=1 Tax=Cloacibacillus sp. An23 TaxID=1965591 RepID=UPI000B369C75|nr:hypothetical protein [Cloacibacillus sp. An23]OUO94122.1 hypothetical protein B5F39_05505 [Cloacibacillus sp. An23]